MPTDPGTMIGFLLCMFIWCLVSAVAPMAAVVLFVTDRTTRRSDWVSVGLGLAAALALLPVVLVFWVIPVATLIFDWWGVSTT